ncbi:fluoride efflux transporter CrcB [Bacteroidales bacterium OttesenSCG-928-J19]|nr:fluoride efflux transporter CrcB [Bacteroidales bacterium OttesenSCG-928-J19]
MIKEILLVGLGGGVGSIFRYLTSVLVSKHCPSIFPWGTLVVNVIGCLLIGLLLGMIEKNQLLSPGLRFLLVTGFCGGYTTFSTFALENVNLFNTQHSLTAILYIAASILLGLLAVWGGLYLIKLFG